MKTLMLFSIPLINPYHHNLTMFRIIMRRINRLTFTFFKFFYFCIICDTAHIYIFIQAIFIENPKF